MAVSRKAKEETLAELKENLSGAKAAVFADYRGTTVKNISKLRKNFRKENVYTKVAKISLIKIALKEQGIDVSGMDFKVPVAIAISKEDEVAPARILSEFMKENKNVKVLAGIMDNKVLSASEVTALAALPSKQDMRGMLVRTMIAPVSGFVNVMAAQLRSFVYVLNAIKDSKN